MNHPIPFALKLPIVIVAILVATLAYARLTASRPAAEQQGTGGDLNNTPAEQPID